MPTHVPCARVTADLEPQSSPVRWEHGWSCCFIFTRHIRLSSELNQLSSTGSSLRTFMPVTLGAGTTTHLLSLQSSVYIQLNVQMHMYVHVDVHRELREMLLLYKTMDFCDQHITILPWPTTCNRALLLITNGENVFVQLNMNRTSTASSPSL